MNLEDILNGFTFSAAPDSQLSTRGTSLPGTAIMSRLWQASPLLARMTLRFMKDPHEPTQDPVKPGLRTGRTQQGRFAVRANPASQSHQFVEFDSSAVFTRTELATLFGGLTPEQARELIEAITLLMFADDVLRIGFYGQFAADSTNPVTHPNGEDVATGWQALAKQHDPEGQRILRNPVTFDPAGTGDYRDLDSMVYRLLEALPAQWRQDPRLQVLVGGDLLAAHKQAHLAPGQMRSKEQQLKIADLPVNTHQHMPGNLLAVTFLSNLQVLTLELGHSLATGDLNDDNTWGVRYWRPQTYALGAPEAYAAFDAITLTQPNEE
ncbi:P2 family phage major capsid protein [Aeromonas bivalvium]|uniref:P2 family phage major capsid protein n=1 Tax=Aeromonas bivalvium TaxID=440079 RepID=UPI0038D083A5